MRVEPVRGVVKVPPCPGDLDDVVDVGGNEERFIEAHIARGAHINARVVGDRGLGRRDDKDEHGQEKEREQAREGNS